MEALLSKEVYNVAVNLEVQTVTGADGVVYSFDIDPYQKKMLLNGWDEISINLPI